MYSIWFSLKANNRTNEICWTYIVSQYQLQLGRNRTTGSYFKVNDDVDDDDDDDDDEDDHFTQGKTSAGNFQVSSHLHAPVALHPRKEPLVPIG